MFGPARIQTLVFIRLRPIAFKLSSLRLIAFAWLSCAIDGLSRLACRPSEFNVDALGFARGSAISFMPFGRAS